MTTSGDRQMIWVYGVVPAGAALVELERRGGTLPEVWVVEAGEIGAIAGPAPPEDAKGTRDQALAHARVLEAAVADAPVVPFRFGMVVADGRAIGEELLPHHDEFVQLLRRVEHHVQMSLRVAYVQERLLRRIVEQTPEIAGLRDALRDLSEVESRAVQIRLGELVDAAIEQAREGDAAALLGALDPVVAAVSVDPPEDEYMVLNAALLIERTQRERFEEAVERLAREHGDTMRFRLLGPMPAYGFVDVEEPAWD